MDPGAAAASAAQSKTADHAPSLAIPGSRPPVGGLGLLFAIVLNPFSKIPPLIPLRGLFSHPAGAGVDSR